MASLGPNLIMVNIVCSFSRLDRLVSKFGNSFSRLHELVSHVARIGFIKCQNSQLISSPLDGAISISSPVSRFSCLIGQFYAKQNHTSKLIDECFSRVNCPNPFLRWLIRRTLSIGLTSTYSRATSKQLLWGWFLATLETQQMITL